VKYAWLRMQESEYSVRALCRALGVSPSGYYAWRDRPLSPREIENDQLVVAVSRLHLETRQNFGSDKLWRELRRRGVRCGRHRIARLRRRHGIFTKRRRRFIRARKPYDRMPPAPRLVKWPFKTKQANRVWAGDITLIPTARGWLHLAALIDHCTRQIVGWSMSSRPDQKLVGDALEMALQRHRPAPGLIHHSDQGSQYTSSEFKAQLRATGLRQSMSRKGMPYDNAIIESFFSTLKNELTLDERFLDHDQAKAAVFDYIEVFYNRKRCHQSLGYRTPVEFSRLKAA
jgi:putative transposase